MIARVASVTNTDAWAKSGVMFRGSTAASAANAAVLVSAGQGVAFQWRASAGGTSAFVRVTGVAAPQWVKLTRSGSSFSGYYSSDGVTWTMTGKGVTTH